MTNILNLYSISGLFYELYQPILSDFSETKLDINSQDPFYRTNALFWAKLFSTASLSELVNKIKTKSSNFEDFHINAILANPDLFIKNAHIAPIKLIDNCSSLENFYAELETIAIACKMYSTFVYNQELTIQDGFLTPDYSANKTFELAISENNPFIIFFEQEVFPLMKCIPFKLVWLNGKINLSLITLAMHARKLNPNCFICVRYHSSEYYSLNKITDFLSENTTLFSLIDCIVLDENETTFLQIESLIESNNINQLNLIPNIMFIDRKTNKIFITKTEKKHFNITIQTQKRISNKQCNLIKNINVANMNLNPNQQCFWKKCTFCGINEKYKYITEKETISIKQKLGIIANLINQGITYFWFGDEALPIQFLSEFADLIIKEKLHFYWQARTRFSVNINKELCNKLFKAGLREIRLGLESASPRILKSMNKFDDISLDSIEQNIKDITNSGIHLHCPLIVGYPNETQEDRHLTYSFLKKMKQTYPLFSYNVNILMLDVSSTIYKNFTKFNISGIFFPCEPNDFLGNFVSYISSGSSNYHLIDKERQQFMAQTLYPWLPSTSIIKSHILYRLSETIRNTLLWSTQKNSCSNPIISPNINYVASQDLSTWQTSEGYFYYNWKKHYLIKSPSFFNLKQIYNINNLDLSDLNKALLYGILKKMEM